MEAAQIFSFVPRRHSSGRSLSCIHRPRAACCSPALRKGWRSGDVCREGRGLVLQRLPREWGATRLFTDAMVQATLEMGVGAGGTRKHLRAIVTRWSPTRSRARRTFTGRRQRSFSLQVYVSNEASLGAIGRLLPRCLILSDERRTTPP